jgi:putative transposase
MERVHQLVYYDPVLRWPEIAGKIDKPEHVVLKLRQVEVLHKQGMAITDVVRQFGATVQMSYRGHNQHGGMSRDQLKPLKELEAMTSCVGSDAWLYAVSYPLCYR